MLEDHFGPCDGAGSRSRVSLNTRTVPAHPRRRSGDMDPMTTLAVAIATLVAANLAAVTLDRDRRRPRRRLS
jgi:hypothetical protein